MPLFLLFWLPRSSLCSSLDFILLKQHAKKYNKNRSFQRNKRFNMVRPVRFERMAFGVGVQRSIQLSYGREYSL